MRTNNDVLYIKREALWLCCALLYLNSHHLPLSKPILLKYPHFASDTQLCLFVQHVMMVSRPRGVCRSTEQPAIVWRINASSTVRVLLGSSAALWTPPWAALVANKIADGLACIPFRLTEDCTPPGCLGTHPMPSRWLPGDL